MNMMMTICAECKKELEMTCSSTVDGAPVSAVPNNEEVIYSHGICFECGIKLYGAELMGKVCAKHNLFNEDIS
jgi:hypothetical protein